MKRSDLKPGMVVAVRTWASRKPVRATVLGVEARCAKTWTIAASRFHFSGGKDIALALDDEPYLAPYVTPARAIISTWDQHLIAKSEAERQEREKDAAFKAKQADASERYMHIRSELARVGAQFNYTNADATMVTIAWPELQKLLAKVTILALLPLAGCTPPALATGLPHSVPMACVLLAVAAGVCLAYGYDLAAAILLLFAPGFAN